MAACKKLSGGALERGADLHMVQLMPLPLTVCCFSKIQIGFTFLVPAHPGSLGQRAVKRVGVCVSSMALRSGNIVGIDTIFVALFVEVLHTLCIFL